jgi:hypothetical protein
MTNLGDQQHGFSGLALLLMKHENGGRSRDKLSLHRNE